MRIKNITRVELVELGVTRSMADTLLKFYHEADARGVGRPTSAARAELMSKCIDLLSDAKEQI